MLITATTATVQVHRCGWQLKSWQLCVLIIASLWLQTLPSAQSSVLQFITLGLLELDYALMYSVVGLLGSFVGQKLVDAIIKKYVKLTTTPYFPRLSLVESTSADAHETACVCLGRGLHHCLCHRWHYRRRNRPTWVDVRQKADHRYAGGRADGFSPALWQRRRQWRGRCTRWQCRRI